MRNISLLDFSWSWVFVCVCVLLGSSYLNFVLRECCCCCYFVVVVVVAAATDDANFSVIVLLDSSCWMRRSSASLIQICMGNSVAVCFLKSIFFSFLLFQFCLGVHIVAPNINSPYTHTNDDRWMKNENERERKPRSFRFHLFVIAMSVHTHTLYAPHTMHRSSRRKNGND